MLNNRVTTILGIDTPILMAPMGRWAEPSLAVAVSQAGGLGSFGAWPHMGLDAGEVRRHVARIRQGTDRPFGAGFVNHLLPDHRANFDAALEERVPVIMLSFGDPSPWIPLVRQAGSKAVCQVQSFELAAKAVDAGADILCVQGNEAGGHTGSENLLPFLIQVLEAFPGTPVVASGGITSGRALAAVLAAGAEGAWIGTALVAAEEAAFTSPELRRAIVASNGRDTVRSSAIDIVLNALASRPPWPNGVALRHGPNEITERWHGKDEQLAQDSNAIAGYVERLTKGTGGLFPLLYGEGAGSIREIKTAKVTIDSLVGDAVALLARFGR
ncbi:NAD(P)H-dependent flavin oxidoreductase [Reyranella sp.]|uniref:NAD(P)H-dependent flavin oxidoreductase n=1 Tax=Reyranella sp. TaxID=1929291 RepID=UPI003D13090A